MKIFITGVAGFVGSSLAARLLAAGHSVTGIDNLYTGFRSNVPDRVRWAEGDITNYDDLASLENQYDVVVHTAAQTSGEKSFLVPLYDLETNIKGSYNTFEFAKKCCARLMINFSSMSAYGDIPDQDIVSETYVSQPVSLYGNSKVAAENMLKILSEKDDLPVVSFRLFNAYGPKQNLEELKQGMISIYLAQFLGQEFETVIVKGSMDRVRDFIYIDDIVDALMAVIFGDICTSNIFNLSSGETTSVDTIVSLIRQISRIDKKVIQEAPTPGDIQGFGGDCSLLQRVYDWKPRINVETGLKKMIHYYMEKGIDER